MTLPPSVAPFVPLLMRGRWFSGLPEALRQRILADGVLKTYAKGQVLSTEGVPPPGMFALLTGRLRLVRHVEGVDEVLLHVAEPGFWSGGAALVPDVRALVTFVAAEPATVLLLTRSCLERIGTDDFEHYRCFVRLVLEQMAVLARYAAESSVLASEQRLRARLATLAELREAESSESRARALRVSQAELAEMVGASRQRLNALLQKIEADGAIERRARGIVVVDAGALRRPRGGVADERGD